jgi:hypothetical protein
MHVLTWIDYIATYSDLKRLINTGKTIKKVLQRRAKHTNPFRCGKEVTLLNSWLVDLVPLVANFGERKRRNRKSFLENPASIYHLLPLFCQPESAPLKPLLAGIHGTRGMQLAGLSNKTWGDYLSTILEPQEQISRLACSATCFAISTNSRTIKDFNQVIDQICQEVKTLRNKHKTPVNLLRFGTKEAILASSDSKMLLI